MQIAKNVQVYGRNGRYLYRRHKAKAQRLIEQSRAISESPALLRLPQIQYEPIKRTSDLRATCLGGQPIAGDCERERGMPNTWAHQDIHPDDKDLFIAPVMECIRYTVDDGGVVEFATDGPRRQRPAPPVVPRRPESDAFRQAVAEHRRVNPTWKSGWRTSLPVSA